MRKKILIVGAGFAGAVHARVLAECGYSVDLIDRRNHIGGNAYDYTDENGIRVHAYGPHLFHTKNSKIIDWLSRFGNLVPYEHKVRALLPSGQTAPLPINLDTLNIVFDSNLNSPTEAAEFLGRLSVPLAAPRSAAEYLYSKIGRELTDLFFRPYTKKMWGFDLEEMSAAVVKRIPLNFDRVDTYFYKDEIQVLPQSGYTVLFESMLDHPSIRVHLSVMFAHDMLNDYSFCFNSMPIDEFYQYQFGDLPYRSIKFHSRTELATTGNTEPSWSVTNFTDLGPYTRETAWHILPYHLVSETGKRTFTREEPCDYKDNNFERYYPVKTADERYQKIYQQYHQLSCSQEKSISFIGRCGTYQYLDMDQVINQSLANVNVWLAQQ
ncbi:MAG: UDP-galactopyranose mutase [Methylocystaceae bacterium]|nr:MAG: UDP-galactopyranose mutase [Methylocystaceae bacterium]